MTDADLVRLGDASYLEALREQARATGGTLRESDGVLLASGVDGHPLHNYAVRIDARRAASDAYAEIDDHFGRLGRGYLIVTMNAHDDRPLARMAREAGATEIASPPAMFCPAPPDERPFPPEVTLAEVVDEGGLAAYRDVSAAAWATYGIPPPVTAQVFSSLAMVCGPHLRAVVAYVGGRPASCAMILLSHGIAGVYWVGTHPDARGKGLADACTRRMTRMGFELGARVVTLQASVMGEPIYRKMGYRSIGSYSLWAQRPRSSDAAQGEAPR
jgi:ribosomal protein S18 acetylase RimI-like enzyme